MGLAPRMKAPPREMGDGVWRRRRDGFRVTVFVGESKKKKNALERKEGRRKDESSRGKDVKDRMK
ncbi:hypothetical protein EYF80_029663 [Liparis tanakae]|uniref:Uncharacterized protein n=1 Tax=Liparis tanakae TaxID=230148 RepID=A0A4Z2H3C5_9TELE|nr:hypothetical protein EYF80_029663 [Liparis tanakae]